MRLKNWPTKKYDLIVVDPPWPIKTVMTQIPRLNQTMAYQTMSLQEIKDMPIESIQQDKCICALWSIQRFLPYSFNILNIWGFDYKLTLTWDKHFGMSLMGFHYRTEFVLIGSKGKNALPMFPRRPTVPSCIDCKRPKKHSQKPKEFYRMIRPFGKKRIDLFARKRHFGYDAWGDEV